MYYSLTISYWLSIILAVPAAGFLVRIFIIFHDCGHGSYFKSRRANTILGFIAGVLTFVPYSHWSRKHAMHHASAGDLERRGIGDVWTLTVDEYRQLSKIKRLEYRIYRHPLILFLIGPVYLFLFNNRFVTGTANSRERSYVYWTNISIILLAATAIILIGLKAYLLIQLPVIVLSGIAGIWLFYVQHQFDGAYWTNHEDWDFQDAAIIGSSFYKLPRVMQWFSGNIGFHHIHHLSPRIPNYHLESCHNNIPAFENVKAITFLESLKFMKYKLWDEQQNKLVGFKQIA